MCYNGYQQDQYQYPNQYPDQYLNQYSNQYPIQYQGNCGCHVYPVPFMPTNPLYAHAYVPYQISASTFPLKEALMRGTIFPELSNLYNPYRNYLKEEK